MCKIVNCEFHEEDSYNNHILYLEENFDFDSIGKKYETIRDFIISKIDI